MRVCDKISNLKPRNLVGFKSHGMVLCASEGDRVEFVDPPLNAKPGDRISGLGLQGEPLSASQCDKQKAFDIVAKDLKVDQDGVLVWKDTKVVVASDSSECKAPTLRSAFVH